MPTNADIAGPEYFPQLVTDEIDDRLEVELRRYALLDAVDHRQLCRALFGFLQQPLRLVEQSGILERDAHAARQRLKQPHIRIAKGVHALLPDGDHAIRRTAVQDGNVDERVVHRAAAYVLGAQLRHPLIQLVGGMNHDGLQRPENMCGETTRRSRRRMKSLAVVEEEDVANQI